MALRTRTPGARALLPATRYQSSGQLGALLSSPVLDVRLMTALQVLQGYSSRTAASGVEGAVEHPSGGPSAPGRRCWRLGRKRPSPFSNSGPTPLRSDPNLEGLKSLRCCCAKGVGHRAQLMLRARRGDRETTTLPVIAYTNTTKALSLLSSLTPGGHNY